MDYLMMQLGDPSRALMGGLGDGVEGQARRRVGDDRYVFDRARGRGVFDSTGVLVRKLIGPPHAHLDGPCTDACYYEVAEHERPSDIYGVAERRQASREAFDDEWSGVNDMFGTEGWAERLHRAREVTIETATRVMITDEAVSAFGRAWHAAPQDGPPGTRRRAALAAAVTALGFEVVE